MDEPRPDPDLPCVLAVDDVPANLVALERVLGSLPVRVVSCTSGQEALRATLHDTFAVAIIDVQMPGMDGYELAHLLRGADGTRGLPIIFLTAVYGDAEHAFRGYEAGAVDYLTKPFEPDILRTKVRVFLSLYEQRRSLLRLSDELREANARLRAQQDRLNEIVAKRTADLEATVVALREEIGRREALERDLARSNRELEQFAHLASHDLKTPLRTISGFAGALSEDLDQGDAAEAREFARRIEAAVARMTRLIDDLLELSRPVRRATRLEPVELGPVASEVIEDLRAPIDRAGARVDLGPLPRVRGDRGELYRLLLNLVENAVKFGMPGRPPRVRVSAVPLEAGTWRVSVEDNGTGFDPSQAERVFLPFARLHGARPGGIGVGLSKCRRIVERLGGRIWAEGRPGQGATFHFTLQAA